MFNARFIPWRTTCVAAFVSTLCGCDGGEDLQFFRSAARVHELAPGGRAVAFIDRGGYQAILDSDGLFGLDGLTREFFSAFDNQPDSLIFVLDFETPNVSVVRELLELGYDPLNLPEDPPADLRAYLEDLRDIPTSGSFAFNRQLRAFASGLGNNPQSALGPSTLRSHAYLPLREDLVSGRFLHEFGHNWSAYLNGPPVLAAQVREFGHHWGYSSVGGILGGWIPRTFIELQDGRYHASRLAPGGWATTAFSYAPLELYLMGLIAAEAVPPIDVALRPQASSPGEFRADGLQRVTIEDIIAANGPRLPGVEEAPKHFRIAVVILAAEPLRDEDWDFFERALAFMSAPGERFVDDIFPETRYPAHHVFWDSATSAPREAGHLPYRNFFMATGGRATLEFVEPLPRGD